MTGPLTWYRAIVCAFVALSAIPLSAQDRFLEKTDLRRAEALRYARFAEQATQAARPTEVDVTYYKLDIHIFNYPGQVTGSVLTVATVVQPSVNRVTFDLNPTMTVDSAFVDGVRADSVTRPGATAVVYPHRSYSQGEKVSVLIYEHGQPSASGFGSFGDALLRDNTTRWYWTLSEPYGARDWWPCIDHPSDKADSADVWITCDSGYVAASQGLLAGVVNNPNSTVTYRWTHRYPIATYLISVTVCKFDTFSDWYRYSPNDSMEVRNYVTPDISRYNLSYRSIAARTPLMLATFAGMFGEYPFVREKYGHAEFGWAGGMEHQTLTSLGTMAFREDIVAHELAHQWFGDMITCRTWPDLWLNEGFATYCEALYYEKHPGISTYRGSITPNLSSATGAVGSLYVQDTTDVRNLFAGSRVYDKGASVLHMLRHVLGDSTFFKAMKAYATNPQLMYKTAATADFRAACESVYGHDLGWFFNEWVFGERYPHYSYSWNAVPNGNASLVRVRIQQNTGTTNPPFFIMPIDIRFLGPGLDTTTVVMNNEADQTFVFTLNVRPDNVTLDPDDWILKNALPIVEGEKVILEQNYPNPFNPGTVIRYQLSMVSEVSVKVFDLLGREIAELDRGRKIPGVHEINWNAAGHPSGVYYCRLQAGDQTRTRAMVLVK